VAAPSPSVTPIEHPYASTLVAVARHNGRLAPAARELGVHRNTVRYRIRRASDEIGLDPRRPADALRILGLRD
jgi:DNA-binding PucR family transcriptional regulator